MRFQDGPSLCCIHQLNLLSLSLFGNDCGELVPLLFLPRKTLVWAVLLLPHRSMVETSLWGGIEGTFFPFCELSAMFSCTTPE